MTKSEAGGRRRAGRMLPLLAVAVMLNGCLGYRRGTLVHPQLQRVAIGTVRNLTEEPRLAVYLRTRLPEALQRDGSLRVVSRRQADCLLQADITSYRLTSIGSVESTSEDDDQDVYRSTIYRVTVEIAFSVTVPGREAPLLPTQTVEGAAEFAELVDLDTVRKDGLRQAVYDASGKIAAALTEAW
jgi:hypothetical protein